MNLSNYYIDNIKFLKFYILYSLVTRTHRHAYTRMRSRANKYVNMYGQINTCIKVYMIKYSVRSENGNVSEDKDLYNSVSHAIRNVHSSVKPIILPNFGSHSSLVHGDFIGYKTII